MTGQDKSVVTMLSEWALETAFENGVQLKETAAGAKPPLVAIVGFMRQLSMSYATNDLLLDFAFKAKFPGAQLFIPIEIDVDPGGHDRIGRQPRQPQRLAMVDEGRGRG